MPTWPAVSTGSVPPHLEIHDILAGAVVLIGLVGIVLVFIPGIALQAIAVSVWAFEESSGVGWAVLVLVLGVAVAVTVLKFLYPRKRLIEAGVPSWVLFAAVLAAIVGLFVIPLAGAPIAFVGAIYMFERARVGRSQAWPSTKVALRALLTSTGIELVGGFLIAGTFFAGALIS